MENIRITLQNQLNLAKEEFIPVKVKYDECNQNVITLKEIVDEHKLKIDILQLDLNRTETEFNDALVKCSNANQSANDADAIVAELTVSKIKADAELKITSTVQNYKTSTKYLTAVNNLNKINNELNEAHEDAKYKNDIATEAEELMNSLEMKINDINENIKNEKEYLKQSTEKYEILLKEFNEITSLKEVVETNVNIATIAYDTVLSNYDMTSNRNTSSVRPISFVKNNLDEISIKTAENVIPPKNDMIEKEAELRKQITEIESNKVKVKLVFDQNIIILSELENKYEEDKKNLDSLNGKIVDITKTINDKNKEIENYNNEVIRITKEIDDVIEEHNSKIEKEKRRLEEEEREKQRKEKEIMRSESTEYNTNIFALERIEQQINEQTTKYNGILAAKRQMEQTISNSKQIVDQYKKNVDSLENYKKEHDDLKIKAKNMKASLEDIVEKFNDLTSSIAHLEKKKNKYENKKDELNKTEKKEYKNIIAMLEEHNENLNLTKQNYNITKIDYEQIENKVSNSRKNKKQLAADVKKGIDEISIHTNQISDTEKIIEQKSIELEKINKEIIKLTKLKNKLAEAGGMPT